MGEQATAGVESECVAVWKKQAEVARRILSSENLLRVDLRPEALGDEILFPVTSSPEAVRALSRAGIRVRECRTLFKARRRGPQRLSGPVRSYAIIGEIAVFSKTSGVGIEEYRRLARELLESIPRIRSVYLKEETSGPFRVPALAHLAGEEGTRTIAREYGLEFEVDIARVYYNPRLQEERRRIALLAREGEKIIDMFAGVGVFPLHIASQKKAVIVGNDLNPVAVELMARNVRRNRRRLRGCIIVSWGDAMDLPSVFKPVFDRIIMNNPTMTPRFLRGACRLLAGRGFIHYYRLAGSCSEAIVEARESVGGECVLEPLECRGILEYSPGKTVYVVDFDAERIHD